MRWDSDHIGIPANTAAPADTDDFTLTGSPPAPGRRFYRIKVVP